MTLHCHRPRAAVEGGNPHDGRQLAGGEGAEKGAEAAFHPEWLNAGNKKTHQRPTEVARLMGS